MHRGFGPGSGRGSSVGGGGGGGGKGGGKIAGLYDLEETLGSGHFAVVKLARHVFTGEKVAVKVIDKSKLDEVSRAHLFQEVRCMKLVQHPNVVRLYEVIDTQTKLYLILELGDGGDLYDYIMKHDSGLSEDLARDYFAQIVRAISYCHSLHVVHRDLKPENVVFFERLGVVKLTDFGFSNKFCPGQKLETSCGSLAYSAPEILLGDSYDAPAVDVWSLGVILYMLVCGRAPFQEANDSETLTMIMDCKYAIPRHVSDDCKRLIAKMLVRQPDERATLPEIAADPWVRGASPETDATDGVDDILPLVSRQRLNDEDHALIIQKMVNGQIATKDRILEALDKNEYDHVTATYYLLAERKLRMQRQEKNAPKRPEALGVSDSVRNDVPDIDEDVRENRLLVPSQPRTGALLTVPRTPGDIPQRARKCSIVREEDDDDDGASGRRGSRSEGRLHMALQERLPAAIANVNNYVNEKPGNLSTSIHKIAIEDENTRKRLGDSGMGSVVGWMPSFTKKNGSSEQGRPKSAIESTLTGPAIFSIPKIVKTPASFNRSEDFKSELPLLCEDELSPIMIKEASTITIPISKSNNKTDFSHLPPFKSMPSPIKMQNIHSLTDVSDECQIVPEKSIHHRRTKYQRNLKSTSCSSSEASDDESESHKKKSPKHVNTPTHKPLPQRRDSHDDSSDSQEQGAVGGGGNSTSSSQVKCVSNDSNSNVNCDKDTKNSGNNGGSLNRKHRVGRRSCETRLRESQSLNRITEVHEADMITSMPEQKSKKFFNSTKFLQNFSKKQHRSLVDGDKTNKSEMNNSTEKVKVNNLISSLNSNSTTSDEKENCQKLVSVPEKHSFKKVRLLTRYFQVHKKFCFPRMPTFSSFSNRNGRLYKAQSCGSIVRDKITSAGASSLLLVNELCKDKPLVLDAHRARIKLISEMNSQVPDASKQIHMNSIANNLSVCKVHLGDASKCCGLC